MKKAVLSLTIVLFCAATAFAQDEKTQFSANANFTIANKFLFRGVEMTKAPNIQGDAFISYKGWTFGLWATTNFTGTFFEPDFYISYALDRFVFMLYDFDTGGGKDFFNYSSNSTTHIDELSVQYTVSDKLPLSLLVGTCFWGADKKIDYWDTNGNPVFKNENNFSTYIELSYPFDIEKVNVTPVVGFTTHESYTYLSDDFAFINVGLTFDKSIRLSEKMAIPVSFSFVYNQAQKRVHSLMRISF